MAFNFNWSSLATDTSFYDRAKELLTNALNRAGPRPAIIVDDFLVNELNLGDVPPELEIVEIGDLAEDRFRGTFKMRYQGDAVLSLKTRVQANPLNTYLVTRSSFASPQPLAAATGLTIPLQITLSDIRLSGFIILVFSRQKGLTIVFKDDPLQSLRVSSTFDSIPFVANYLQKEIEGQLRNLLMDELPAIIHRLSLRLCLPEHKARDDREPVEGQQQDDVVVDPLASPPQDPVDSTGNVLSPAEVASLSLDSSIETQSLFSQKNLIRLATLTDSHRTLSLFTPNIRDAVFRAWTGPLERGEMSGLHTRSATPALSRSHSHTGSLSTTYTFDGTSQARPSLYSLPSSANGLAIGGGRHSKAHGMRKRKKRIVNLRKQPEEAGTEGEVIIEDGSTADTASVTESTSTAPSIFSAPPASTAADMVRERELPGTNLRPAYVDRSSTMQNHTTQMRPEATVAGPSRLTRRVTSLEEKTIPPSWDSPGTIRSRRRRDRSPQVDDMDATPRASMYLPDARARTQESEIPPSPTHAPTRLNSQVVQGSTSAPLPNFLQFISDASNGGGIVEQAWMVKIAGEMARRYEEERSKGNFERGGSQQDDRAPPPAYAR